MARSHKRSKTISAVVAAAAALMGSGAEAESSYPANLFSVNQLHFNEVRQPHGLDWYMQSGEAKAIVGAIAAYMGIDPKYVTLAMNAIPRVNVNGEEALYELPLATGYAYCSARIGVSSLAPGDGDRASIVDSSVFPDGTAKIYTWTPVRHFGEGRAWATGDLQVTGILPRYQAEFIRKGICAPLTQQVPLLKCQGNPCPPAYHGGSHKGDVAKKAPEIALEGFAPSSR